MLQFAVDFVLGSLCKVGWFLAFESDTLCSVLETLRLDDKDVTFCFHHQWNHTSVTYLCW